MSISLAGIRQQVFDRLDWNPKASPEQKVRVNRAINRALLQLVQDCPNAFFQDTRHVTWQPDVIPSLSTDRLNVLSNDAWTLETSLVVGTSGAVVWDTGRKWDGRMLMLWEDGNESQKHERRIRHIWQSGNRIRITIWNPWPTLNVQNLNWKVFTDAIYMPDDVIQVQSIRHGIEGNHSQLEIIGQNDAENMHLDAVQNVYNYQPDITGLPRIAFRRDPFAMQAPTYKPEVAIIGATVWDPDVPQGEFQYCYTFCWGLRDRDWAPPGPQSQGATDNTTSRVEPLWESAPSPESDAINCGGQQIRMSLPDVEWMNAFGDNTTPRYRRSGWYLRIYRKRISQTTSPSGIGPIEISSDYQLISVVSMTGGYVPFIDGGGLIPDWNRPLRDVASYQSFGLYPRPNKEMSITIRCTRRPIPLVDENDTPWTHPDAELALIDLACRYIYETQGNMAGMNSCDLGYAKRLGALQKRYGDMRPAGVPVARDIARVGGLRGRRRTWNGY